MNALQVTWFCLIGVLLAGYIILDGFDLGVGLWYLFARNATDRRALMSSILPFWDGNEVWLLTGGGALFAAFPHVYATVFSGLYLALMILMFALIFRAVSIEFRSVSDHWSGLWDGAFSIGSIIPVFLLGVAAGNILRGLPLDEHMNYTGSFIDLLNLYSLLIGITSFAMFATHGALFAVLRTTGDLAVKASKWAHSAWICFLALFLASAAVTIITQSQLMANYSAVPALLAIPAIALLAILAIGHYNRRGAVLKAFLASATTMLALMAAGGAAIFPKMVPALGDPSLSLTIMNSSSSPLTLKTMLIIALIGIPIVLAYTVWIHRIFRGKVSEDESY